MFAVTQLSHLLLAHLDAGGGLRTTLLCIAIWLAWIYTNVGEELARPRAAAWESVALRRP